MQHHKRQEMNQMQSIFSSCFATQQSPLFPSPLFDGSFDQLAVHLQEYHWQDIQDSLNVSEISLLQGYQGALLLKKVILLDFI